jgi:hypothetical protein
VGDAPPDGEQRHSAPDIDSGLNAFGMYGGLSFIIEAAAYEGAAPPGDLGNRVDAYLVLYRRFLSGGSRRAEDLAAIERARRGRFPRSSRLNYLWVNPGRRDGVPRRRDRDLSRREDPDAEHDDGDGRQVLRPDAARLRRRPGRRRAFRPSSKSTGSPSRRLQRPAP